MSLNGWAKAIRSNGGNASSLRGMSRNSSVGNSASKTGAGARSGKKSGASANGRKARRNESSPVYRVPTQAQLAKERAKWQAESDMSTLATAAEILKSPTRVKAAQQIAKEKEIAARKATEAVTGVRAGKGE
jgi:hypothetical protein